MFGPFLPMHAADWLDLTFKLQVYACDVGAGAVLLQTDEKGVERSVSYFSKNFEVYQRHYSVIEKHTLALIWALQHFDACLVRFHLVVYTDHNLVTFFAFTSKSESKVDAMGLVLATLSFGHMPYQGQRKCNGTSVTCTMVIRCPLVDLPIFFFIFLLSQFLCTLKGLILILQIQGCWVVKTGRGKEVLGGDREILC